MASEGGVLEPSDVKMSLSRPGVRLVEDLWTCSVLKLSHIQGYRYHLSKFHCIDRRDILKLEQKPEKKL